MPSLILIVPLLAAYELGLMSLARAGVATSRSGVDSWVRHILASCGVSAPWLPPALLLGALAAWRLTNRQGGRIQPVHLVGMVLESLAFAVVLLAASRVVDLAVARLEQSAPVLSVPAQSAFAGAVSYLGAGIYEEAVFRLALIPALFYTLRLFLVPRVMAGALAIVASSLLFSIAHHAGGPGEVFTWYAFIFRWFAGIYFAWVFVLRGFGIAVGAHVAYDCLVGAMLPYE